MVLNKALCDCCYRNGCIFWSKAFLNNCKKNEEAFSNCVKSCFKTFYEEDNKKEKIK